MTGVDVVVHADAASLVEAVAARLLAAMVAAQANGGSAEIVLTGGRAGTAVCDALAGLAGALDPHRVGLWWGDERYLPAGDPERNDTGAAALVRALPGALVHAVEGPDRSETPEDSAAAYGHAYAAVTPDVALLSIGPDGHIASLFPEHPAVHDHRSLAVAVHGSPKPPPTRVTLTRTGLSRAREIWLIATGAEKAAAVRLSLDPMAGPLQAPAAGLRGTIATRMLVDRAAAADLPADAWRPAP